MDKICTVPKGFGEVDYEICGLPASYIVGSWCVCEGHKKHYCDTNRWPAEPLKGEGEDDQKIECGR